MKEKKIIAIILGVILLIGTIGIFVLGYSNQKEKERIRKEEEQKKIELKVEKIIEENKNEEEFLYGKPEKQEDGTYKVTITDKKTNKSNSYYEVDVENNTYTLIATGFASSCKDDGCEK